ncbi:MAG: hypothetical protein LUG45_01020 [Clostridiales bacterium]|nr:hypothetical protein [Clostridiales bacterium]
MGAKDLTGQRFGRLTVLRLGEPTRSPGGKAIRRWVCRCDCGQEITVNQNDLTATKNGTRSCGCLKGDAIRKDMTGQRFGRLTVIGPAPLEQVQASGQRTGWLCQCDCGKTCIVTRKGLMGGQQSCGCLLSETARKKVDEDNVLQRYDGTVISAIKPKRKPNSNNTSGVKGVYWSNREQRWIAKIGVRGKSITIGRFASLEDAAKARRAAEEKYYDPIIKAYEEEQGKDE